MRILFLLLLVSSSLLAVAQPQVRPTAHYLAGAVTERNGMVVFEQKFPVAQRSRAQIYERLQQLVHQLVEVKDKLPHSRITELSPDSGTIAASVEEYIWFKRNAFVWDRAVMRYQLVFNIVDEAFTATMRNIRYDYESIQGTGVDSNYKAEDWITDRAALTSKGKKLTRVGGRKFRVRTIDRKDDIFAAAALAATQ
ncbi:MAG: DUF4468 domain-containing protein [Bacteroidales bacterium]|nr:DUF4468 domain-containing protein [Bacteroidales bacterium]